MIRANQTVIVGFTVSNGTSNNKVENIRLLQMSTEPTYENELDYLLNQDTDRDGLIDIIETEILGTNPEKKDSDSDGTLDGAEDADDDGLTNIEEFNLGSNLMFYDSDFDGLPDGEEIQIYSTSPVDEDTDLDGATDKWEVDNGYNPCIYDDAFIRTVEWKSEEGIKIVTVTISDGDGKAAETLKVEAVEDIFLNENVPGYIGTAHEFTTEGEFQTAIVSYVLAEELFEKDDFEPVLYYFNEETQLMEEVEGQTISGNVITAELSHFSRYIIIDKKEHDKAWDYNIQYDETGECNYKGMDIVFLIDLSGSMPNNDKYGVRKTVTNKFIENLTANDRGAVIDFDHRINASTGFTTDKEKLRSAILKIDSSGGTKFSVAMSAAISLFTTTSYDGEGRNKYIILLTDGEGSYSTTYTLKAAQNNIVVYTVGLGNSVSDSVLKGIANGTGGSYFHASDADKLYGIFDRIAEEADLHKDSDNDGLADYYEKELNNGNLRLGTGVKLEGVNYLDPDSDKDGISDGKELEVGRLGDIIHARLLSSPADVDTDGDGYDDAVDPLPLKNNEYLYLGDEDYFEYLDDVLKETVEGCWIYGDSAYKFICGYTMDQMMKDYQSYKKPQSIPDVYWDAYCKKINKMVYGYNGVSKEWHYFRNELNRVPETLDDMINILQNDSSAWVLISVEKSQYHMYGVDGEYNLKFVSEDGKYEAVYNKEGTSLKQNNNPENMGTYNYADQNRDIIGHFFFDVLPFEVWENVDGVPTPEEKNVLEKYYNNPDAIDYRERKIEEMGA